MEETCRTCEDGSRHWRCASRQAWVRAKHSCKYHKPRDTLLLNEMVYQALVKSISRHPTAEDDPDVIDALLAVQEALKCICEVEGA